MLHQAAKSICLNISSYSVDLLTWRQVPLQVKAISEWWKQRGRESSSVCNMCDGKFTDWHDDSNIVNSKRCSVRAALKISVWMKPLIKSLMRSQYFRLWVHISNELLIRYWINLLSPGCIPANLGLNWEEKQTIWNVWTTIRNVSSTPDGLLIQQAMMHFHGSEQRRTLRHRYMMKDMQI